MNEESTQNSRDDGKEQSRGYENKTRLLYIFVKIDSDKGVCG